MIDEHKSETTQEVGNVLKISKIENDRVTATFNSPLFKLLLSEPKDNIEDNRQQVEE